MATDFLEAFLGVDFYREQNIKLVSLATLSRVDTSALIMSDRNQAYVISDRQFESITTAASRQLRFHNMEQGKELSEDISSKLPQTEKVNSAFAYIDKDFNSV
ncbi:hypothetical protein EON65_08565 [archaeon]|nr:MAG: hypothetical protein EON65_08565 [archaeon]